MATPSRITLFVFDYFISLTKSMVCFLFSLLSMGVLLALAARWFGCFGVLSLYFSAYLSIIAIIVKLLQLVGFKQGNTR